MKTIKFKAYLAFDKRNNIGAMFIVNQDDSFDNTVGVAFEDQIDTDDHVGTARILASDIRTMFRKGSYDNVFFSKERFDDAVEPVHYCDFEVEVDV